MSTLPNRISAFGSMTPGREVALARQLLEIQSEQELDHFLPLLAMAAPLISNIAGPLLKNLAGGLFGGGSKKRKPRDQQEYFLGGIVKGLLGGELETSEYENEAEFQNESEAESYEQEQFLGGILKGIMGGELESAEQEQFLGGLIGKLFGGRELEAENYVQEQFLGGILKGLIGGELEAETAGPPAPGPRPDARPPSSSAARATLRALRTRRRLPRGRRAGQSPARGPSPEPAGAAADRARRVDRDGTPPDAPPVSGGFPGRRTGGNPGPTRGARCPRHPRRGRPAADDARDDDRRRDPARRRPGALAQRPRERLPARVSWTTEPSRIRSVPSPRPRRGLGRGASGRRVSQGLPSP